MPPTILDLFDDPSVVKANPHFAGMRQLVTSAMVSRPSSVAGARYPAVSRAYTNAVHRVLIHERTASAAAAGLEKQIAAILNDKETSGEASQAASTKNGAR
jgi:trehalose/maltose transport system substrate-binding protein